MNKKEEVVEYFNKYGYNLISEFSNNKEKVLLEKDGYKCESTYQKFKAGDRPILFGIRCKYFKENISKYLKEKSPDIEFLDAVGVQKSGKHRIVVTMKCRCGERFTSVWSAIYNGKYALCHKCLKEEVVKKKRVRLNKEYIKSIEEKGYKVLNKSENLYSNTLCEVEEIETGYRGFLYPNRIEGLKKILVFSLYTNKSNLIYNINKYAERNFISSRALRLVDDSDYKEQAVEVLCGCGNKYITTYRSFMKDKWFCDDCTFRFSSNEKAVSSYLDDNEIEYIQEYTVDECFDKRPLRFDFYLKKQNAFIEVAGIQHFQPTDFSKKQTKEFTEKRYEIQVKHDKIKNDFCNKNNYPLLRIKYTEISNGNYAKIINEFIQTIQY